jgi:FtsZ-binding cell division protein ZapB
MHSRSGLGLTREEAKFEFVFQAAFKSKCRHQLLAAENQPVKNQQNNWGSRLIY